MKKKILIILFTILLISMAISYITLIKIKKDLVEININESILLEKGSYYVYCLDSDFKKIEKYNKNTSILNNEIVITFQEKKNQDLFLFKKKLTIGDLEFCQIGVFNINESKIYLFNIKNADKHIPKLYIQSKKNEEILLMLVCITHTIGFINFLYLIFLFLNYLYRKLKYVTTN